MKNSLILSLTLIAALALSACGRKGRLVAPDGQTEDPRLEDFRNNGQDEESDRS